MEKETIMKLFMLAMAMDEIEIINETIEDLEGYKESLKSWRIIQKDKRPNPPVATLTLMITKFQVIDKNFADVFKMICEQSDIINTATEFHKMLDDNNDKKL